MKPFLRKVNGIMQQLLNVLLQSAIIFVLKQVINI